jgi:hypothetical protein
MEVASFPDGRFIHKMVELFEVLLEKNNFA